MRRATAKRWLIGLVCVAALSAPAWATTVTFQPSPANLWNLQHEKCQSWGIQWTVPEGEQIDDAILSIKSIDNWRNEPNALYIHLLDDPKVGTFRSRDKFTASDDWAGQGDLVGIYVDYKHGKKESPSYSMSSLGLLDEFREYAADGVFGFGFDPDGQCSNKGVSLTIITSPVPPPPSHMPEPVTMASVLCGLAMVGGYVRRRLAA